MIGDFVQAGPVRRRLVGCDSRYIWLVTAIARNSTAPAQKLHTHSPAKRSCNGVATGTTSLEKVTDADYNAPTVEPD